MKTTRKQDLLAAALASCDNVKKPNGAVGWHLRFQVQLLLPMGRK